MAKVKHFIIMSSSYSMGKRIALHYIIDEHIGLETWSGKVKAVQEVCGKTVSISTHYIETDSETWDSVIQSDAFFDEVFIVEDLDRFIQLISDDRKLKGIDVAKYVLARAKCTHLKLEKLVYMCYADYLCAKQEKLFDDKIYAFKFGPVIKSVYEKYKGCKYIDDEYGEKEDIELEGSHDKMPPRSRILFAEDGIEKMISIDRTLSQYGSLTAKDLVDITHAIGSPWDSAHKSKPYTEIPDSVILEKHFREVIVS